MISQCKMKIRFFTIADFMEEERWLREEHKSGWKLVKMTPPCFFFFEECSAEDVIYRLDFKNNKQKPDYLQMVNDFGWEYCGSCIGWLYFRKSATFVENSGDAEIFSDNESRIEMVRHIVKTRWFPLFIYFICVLIPNMALYARPKSELFLTGVFSTLFVIYVFLLVYCGIKLRKIKQKLM